MRDHPDHRGVPQKLIRLLIPVRKLNSPDDRAKKWPQDTERQIPLHPSGPSAKLFPSMYIVHHSQQKQQDQKEARHILHKIRDRIRLGKPIHRDRHDHRIQQPPLDLIHISHYMIHTTPTFHRYHIGNVNMTP